MKKLNFIPVGRDYVTRQPKWSTVPYEGEVKGWRGLVCGELSDNVEVIDVDIKNDPQRTIVTDYLTAIPKDLKDKMVVQFTKSKGIHLIYRCGVINGNIWLAKDVSGKVIIETRGEGGYINVVPCKGYTIKQGKTFDDIQTITPEERDQLFEIARGLNRALPWDTEPRKEPVAVRKSKGGLSVSSHITNTAAGELQALREKAAILLNNHILLQELNGYGTWSRYLSFPLTHLAANFPEIYDEVKEVFDTICEAIGGKTKDNEKNWSSGVKNPDGRITIASFNDFVNQVEGKKVKPTPIDSGELFNIVSLRDIMEMEFEPLIYYMKDLINTDTELVVIFGDTGTGKTTYCLHLANSIAGGTECIDGFENEGGTKKVMYLDFELKNRQTQALLKHVEMEGMKSRTYGTEVNEGVDIVRVDASKIPDDVEFEDAVIDGIDQMADNYDVIFIDNLMMLIFEQEKSTAAKSVIRKIKSIAETKSKKIFLVGHTPKLTSKQTRILSMDDLAGSKVVANMADAVIGIGRTNDRQHRYIKHLKSREAKEITYDESNVLITSFSKGRITFEGTDYEITLVNPPDEKAAVKAKAEEQEPRDEMIGQLVREGKSANAVLKALKDKGMGGRKQEVLAKVKELKDSFDPPLEGTELV